MNLQRLPLDPESKSIADVVKKDMPKVNLGLSSNERLLIELFAKYNAKLNPQDRAMIVAQMNKIPKANYVALSSLILSKLGLVQAPELLKGIIKNLQGDKQAMQDQTKLAPKMTAQPSLVSEESNTAIEQLASLLLARQQNDEGIEKVQYEEQEKRHLTVGDRWNNEDLPQNTDDGQRNNHSYLEWLLGRWILNMQNECSVSHRLTTFPIWFDEKLVEVNVAFFDHPGHSSSDNLQSRKLVFSINTDTLGAVEVSVIAADRHLNIDIVAEKQDSADYLAAYLRDLKLTLVDYGWKVDRIKYGVLARDSVDGAMQAVVEHQISQDSLNQLM